VSTLKLIACPRLTLIFVAKPWMVGSPAPATSQSDVGVPGLEFSHATGLVTGVAQGSAAAWPLAGSSASASAANASARASRLVVGVVSVSRADTLAPQTSMS
jgi:hypothetical protein